MSDILIKAVINKNIFPAFTINLNVKNDTTTKNVERQGLATHTRFIFLPPPNSQKFLLQYKQNTEAQSTWGFNRC